MPSDTETNSASNSYTQALQALSDAVRSLLVDTQPIDVRIEVMTAKSEEARQLFLRNLPKGEDSDQDDSTAGANMLGLALAYEFECQHQAANPIFERAYPLLRKNDKIDQPAVSAIELLCNGGRVMSLDGHADLAETFQGRAVEIATALLESHHPYVAQAYYDLAVTLDVQNKPECERNYESSLKSQSNHLSMSANLVKLAGAYAQFQHMEAARRLYARALHMREIASGPGHIDLVPLLLQYGDFEGQVMNDHVRERSLFERALNINEHESGPQSTSTATICVKTAMACMMARDYAAAVKLYEHAMPIREKQFGGTSREFVADLRCMALSQSLAGNPQKAAELFERILVVVENMQPPEEEALAEAAMHLAATYATLKRFDEAIDLVRAVLPRAERSIGSGHPIVTNLGIILTDAVQKAGHPG